MLQEKHLSDGVSSRGMLMAYREKLKKFIGKQYPYRCAGFMAW